MKLILQASLFTQGRYITFLIVSDKITLVKFKTTKIKFKMKKNYSVYDLRSLLE